MSTTAIEVRNRFTELIDTPRVKEQIARALPPHMKLDRFIRICLVTIGNRPDLQECTSLSVMSAIVEASQLGLELDPVLGHGYLLAFKKGGSDKKVCTFIPGYKGFVHLMRNSGLVSMVNAEVVRAQDEFAIELGTQRRLIHVPKLDAEGRLLEKNWLGAYSTVQFKDGATDFEYMTEEEINEHRKRSPAERAGASGPWKTDTAAMWQKTTIRTISRRMPLSPVTQKIVRAATLDEYRENDEYLNREPEAPALEPSGDNSIDVSSRVEDTVDDAQQAPQAPKKDKVTRKSEREARPDNNGVPKANIPTEDAVEFFSPGQVRSIEKLAFEEKNMTKPELAQVLGNHGFEKLTEIPKSAFAKIWQAVSSEDRRK